MWGVGIKPRAIVLQDIGDDSAFKVAAHLGALASRALSGAGRCSLPWPRNFPPWWAPLTFRQQSSERRHVLDDMRNNGPVYKQESLEVA